MCHIAHEDKSPPVLPDVCKLTSIFTCFASVVSNGDTIYDGKIVIHTGLVSVFAFIAALCSFSCFVTWCSLSMVVDNDDGDDDDEDHVQQNTDATHFSNNLPDTRAS